MKEACLMRRRALSRMGGDVSLGMRIGSETIASTIWSPSDLPEVGGVAREDGEGRRCAGRSLALG